MKNSKSSQFKLRLTNDTGNVVTVDVEIVAPSKYLNNFWKTLEMPLINCGITLDLSWSGICVIYKAYQLIRYNIRNK